MAGFFNLCKLDQANSPDRRNGGKEHVSKLIELIS